VKIAFIGLGIMGRPMAKNLLSAGHELVVVARRDEVRADFEGLGATAAATPREAAEQADLVITMLPNSPEVREVALGANGVASATREGLVLIDASSIDPLVTREIAAALAHQGMVMLDAPVSGGEPGAIAGTLSFMVGGPEETFDTYKPVLQAMGSSVVRVGDDHRFDPGFRVALHLKDLTNVLAASHEVAAPMPLTAAVFELMTQLKAHGHESEDHSALLRVYERAAGTRLGETSAT